MKLNYSNQSQVLIKWFGNNWNQADFEVWLSQNGYNIGSNTILEYITYKEREGKKNGIK